MLLYTALMLFMSEILKSTRSQACYKDIQLLLLLLLNSTVSKVSMKRRKRTQNTIKYKT